ncbi:DNA helicase related protein [Labilithrix luteola]|uniref:DNA helicase related protein n=2 Tax=Labilithrix luteola TaxID=1391654 RepID=A0A0K1QGE1_9BACT|nr:DNA helicase related protein [Labilithrix luteola]
MLVPLGYATEAGADPGAGSDAGDEPAEAAQCNELKQRGNPVESVRSVGGVIPTMNGGTIADGTYVLTAVTDFNDVPPDGFQAPYGTETLRIRGGKIKEVFTYPSGDVRRFEATLSIDGANLRITPTCEWDSNPVHFPLLGDWAPAAYPFVATSFSASPTTFTFSTPRGNHQRLILVFKRLCD